MQFFLFLKKEIKKFELKFFIMAPISIFLIFVIYFTMHISYGLGFLKGLFIFIDKWKSISVIDSHFDREKFIKNKKKQSC